MANLFRGLDAYGAPERAFDVLGRSVVRVFNRGRSYLVACCWRVRMLDPFISPG